MGCRRTAGRTPEPVDGTGAIAGADGAGWAARRGRCGWPSGGAGHHRRRAGRRWRRRRRPGRPGERAEARPGRAVSDAVGRRSSRCPGRPAARARPSSSSTEKQVPVAAGQGRPRPPRAAAAGRCSTSSQSVKRCWTRGSVVGAAAATQPAHGRRAAAGLAVGPSGALEERPRRSDDRDVGGAAERAAGDGDQPGAVGGDGDRHGAGRARSCGDSVYAADVPPGPWRRGGRGRPARPRVGRRRPAGTRRPVARRRSARRPPQPAAAAASPVEPTASAERRIRVTQTADSSPTRAPDRGIDLARAGRGRYAGTELVGVVGRAGVLRRRRLTPGRV